MTATALQTEAAASNRRDRQRRTTIKGAMIIFNSRNSSLSCRLRDVSETGARLDFTSPQLLPHEFELQVPGCPSRRCTLCWARGAQAGVRFID